MPDEEKWKKTINVLHSTKSLSFCSVLSDSQTSDLAPSFNLFIHSSSLSPPPPLHVHWIESPSLYLRFCLSESAQRKLGSIGSDMNEEQMSKILAKIGAIGFVCRAPGLESEVEKSTAGDLSCQAEA